MYLRLFLLFLFSACLCHPLLAADAPSPGEIETVMGNQEVQNGAGPDNYLIDGQTVTLPQLLTTILPQRQERLQSMQAVISQRAAAGNAATSAGAIEAKRAQCQRLAANTIDRTRCYQELSMLRDAASQSNQSAADEKQDAENQLAKLDQDIEAIKQFETRYGGEQPATASPLGLGSIPFN